MRRAVEGLVGVALVTAGYIGLLRLLGVGDIPLANQIAGGVFCGLVVEATRTIARRRRQS